MAKRSKKAGRTRRFFVGFWRLLWGSLFCQEALTSLLVVGWTARASQRKAFQTWETMGAKAKGFPPPVPSPWPHWFLKQGFSPIKDFKKAKSFWPKIGSVFPSFAGSFGSHFWSGVKLTFNTYVLTLLPGLLWAFSWYAGWNNSFNKGYEQYAVGMTTGFLGVVIFCMVMTYVPLAQAHQSVTGNWKSFYDFKILRRIILRMWPSCLVLAALYSLLHMPLMLCRLILISDDFNTPLVEKSSDEVLKALQDYYFYWGLILFPVFLYLRLKAAKIYARGLVLCATEGAVPLPEVSQEVREALEAHQLVQKSSSRRPSALVRVVGWAGTRLGRGIYRLAALLIWFSLAAQIYVSAFFNYQGHGSWLNQPLVQLPWMKIVPGHLKEAKADSDAETDSDAESVFQQTQEQSIFSTTRFG